MSASIEASEERILTITQKSKKEKLKEKIKDRKGKLLQRPSKLDVICKWILTIIFGLALLACATFSKLSVIDLGHDLHLSKFNPNNTTTNTRHLSKMTASESHGLDHNSSKTLAKELRGYDDTQRSDRNHIFVILQMIIFIPYALTFLRSCWNIKGRKDLPWPKMSAVIGVSHRPM